MKILVNDELKKKSRKIFLKIKSTYTGHGLTRSELRALERAGYLSKKWSRQDNGQMICLYTMEFQI